MKSEILWWKDKDKKRIHKSEFITVKPYWSIGAGMVFEFSWNDRDIDMYARLYLRASDYGKTWALTREELTHENH